MVLVRSAHVFILPIIAGGILGLSGCRQNLTWVQLAIPSGYQLISIDGDKWNGSPDQWLREGPITFIYRKGSLDYSYTVSFGGGEVYMELDSKDLVPVRKLKGI